MVRAVRAPLPTSRRTFSLADQRTFAQLSGDWNPVHLDGVVARRTIFGAPIVHGIHLLCWALDRSLAEETRGATITSLRAEFRKPAFVGEEVRLDIVPGDATLQFQISARGERLMEATVEWRHGDAAASALPSPPSLPSVMGAPQPPRDLAPGDIAGQRGRVPLGGDATASFPHACHRLGASFVAELLATSRVVGMECPGLHSVFSRLEVTPHDGVSGGRALEYEVTNANLKYSIVDLQIRGPGLAGSIGALYRPVPSAGLTNDEVRALVAPEEFAGQRALVVGGSRGIGEAIARCIALGGGRVCLTYHLGAEEAGRIAQEIGASSMALDVTAPIDLRSRWPLERGPTHVYYLATPRIPVTSRYVRSELDQLLRYYVDGLLAVVEAACSDGERVHVWAPSTIFLTEGGGGAAYAMAKAAMEEAVRRLPRWLPVAVRCPRLPRVATDQTAALIQAPVASPLAIALAELREIAKASRAPTTSASPPAR